MRITKLLKIQIYNYLIDRYKCYNIRNALRILNTLTLIICNLVRKKCVDVELENMIITNIIDLDKYVKFEHNIKHFEIMYPYEVLT